MVVSVSVKIWGTNYRSHTEQTLVKPETRKISTVGVLVSWTRFPVVSGDEIIVRVFVNTNAKDVPPRGYFALQVIHFKLTYLELKNSHSTLYSGDPVTRPAVKSPRTTDWLLTQKVSDSSKVSGNSVILTTVTFQVGNDAQPRDMNDTPISVEIVDMNSGVGLKVVVNTTMQGQLVYWHYWLMCLSSNIILISEPPTQTIDVCANRFDDCVYDYSCTKIGLSNLARSVWVECVWWLQYCSTHA